MAAAAIGAAPSYLPMGEGGKSPCIGTSMQGLFLLSDVR
jgi:hypothetical protein